MAVTYFLIAFLGNFLLIPYILETSQVRKRRISDVCSLHWTCNVPNVHAVDPGIRHILHSQPERLSKRCKFFCFCFFDRGLFRLSKIFARIPVRWRNEQKCH